MSALEALLVVLAGIGAGTINTIVGSGTLITFPTLLLLGVPPVTANISNNIGLVPGQPHRQHRLPPRAGGRPRRTCARLVPDVPARLGHGRACCSSCSTPTCSAPSCRCSSSSGSSSSSSGPASTPGPSAAGPRARRPSRATVRAMQAGVLGAGVYGGYFGAAQGIILMGILGSLSSEPIQRLNGYKNVLAPSSTPSPPSSSCSSRRDRIDWLVVRAHRRRLHGRRGARRHRRSPAPTAGAARGHRRHRPRRRSPGSSPSPDVEGRRRCLEAARRRTDRHRSPARRLTLRRVPTRIEDPADPRLRRLRRPHRRRAPAAHRARARASTSPSPRRSSGGPWPPATARGPTSWPSAGSPTSPTSSSGRRRTASPCSSATTR